MSNHKQINKNWQEFLTEAKYDFKPESPTNSLPREIKKAVEDAVIGFGADMSNRDIPPEDLIAYKQEALGDRSRPTWLYFVRKREFGQDADLQPIPIGSEEFIELWSTEGLDMRAWNGPYPTGNPSAAELAMGNLWLRSLVDAVEVKLGREIDVPMAVEVIPDLDLQDLGVSSEEELSQIDLNDFDLDALGFDEPEPQDAPVPAEMAPAADVEPAAPEEPEPELDDQDKVVAGINSDVYPDSLMNILKTIDFLTKDERGLLLRLMLKATEEDDVVLEGIGDSDRGPRTFSPETTTKLNDLILSFDLELKNQKKLERTIQKWARMNTVKFSAPPKEPEMDFELPPKASEPVDGDPQPEDESEPVDGGPQPEDEESGIVDKAMDTVKQKAQDLGVEIPDVEQVKLALDAISFAGVTGAGEIIATPATIASLALNIATKDWDDALIDVVSLLPVAGKAFKLSAKTAKTAKAAKTLATAADISSRAGKIADVVKKGKAAKNVAKNLGAILGSRLDKGELQQVAKIRDFIAKLADSGVFGDAPSKLSEPFLDMMTAANKAQRDKNNVTESFDRLQTLAGINKRIL